MEDSFPTFSPHYRDGRLHSYHAHLVTPLIYHCSTRTRVSACTFYLARTAPHCLPTPHPTHTAHLHFCTAHTPASAHPTTAGPTPRAPPRPPPQCRWFPHAPRWPQFPPPHMAGAGHSPVRTASACHCTHAHARTAGGPRAPRCRPRRRARAWTGPGVRLYYNVI